ncbi:HAD family hydrolase [Gordonia liuliyuniae]|uniref:Haloacid dehalogenase-like hydrolase n=1 Tax=Gordonia liuliyuniae TaxID=2911517 RepID=A0ABS9INU3_9ACTN|nr:HAD family hydrolase [Gordonia liuliyuniae]MCF8587200.1 haloacid dehalogenase-like hydrolase [Gordonia liuliyuniae]
MAILERVQQPVAVYDLDGVLTRRDTMMWFIGRRLARAPWRLFTAIPWLILMMTAVGNERRASAARRVIETALRGVIDPAYTAAATTFGRQVAASARWMRTGTVDRIRQQAAGGVTIVIATATERRLAESLLRTAQVPYDELSASIFTESSAGMAVRDHRIGARKVDALVENGVPISGAEFVTDSVVDLPTARQAHTVTLIGASRRTRDSYADAGMCAGTFDA